MRLERASDQIDQRGLARAVRADQGPARSAIKCQVDVARDRQCAESAVQPFDLQRGVHVRFLSEKYLPMFSKIPSMPRRANSTASTSIRPMPNCQKVGLSFDR